MLLTDSVDELQLITGIDIPVEDLGVTIHQPRAREISMLGETNYFMALQIFMMNKESVHLTDPSITNWMIFQKSITQKIEGVPNTQKLIANFLQLFFTSSINIGPRSLLLTTKDGVNSIEPENFDHIQRIVAEVGGKSLLSPSEAGFNPKNKKAAEIAEKMKRMRKKVAAAKGANPTKSKGFLSRYIKTVAIGTSNTLEEINNMTIYQINSLMQNYLSWEAYDLDVKSRLAGAKNDNELVHWTVAADRRESGDLDIGTI